MSIIRQHIDLARSDYQSVRYPGRLSRELLSKGRPRLGMWISVMVGAAVAASVMVFVRPGLMPAGPAAVVSPATSANVATNVAALPVKTEKPVSPIVARGYQFPNRVPLALPMTPLVPPLPTVSVSLSWIPENLAPLQQSYEEWIQHFSRHNWSVPAQPLPEKGSYAPMPFLPEVV